MVKNKSQQNKRLSGRRSDILNDDSNLVENNDPLRLDRTAVRPSTSQSLLKSSTPFLSANSSVRSSQLSDDWYKLLSQSETSRLEAEALKNKSRSRDGDRRVSESESVVQKRRANLKTKMKHPVNKDNSNAFEMALEDTTNSSHSTRVSPKALDKPGPLSSKIARRRTRVDKALERARILQASRPKFVPEAGSRIVRFGDLSEEKIQKLIHPWGVLSSPRRSKSPTPPPHTKYRIVESDTASDDEIIVPRYSKRNTKSVEKVRSERATARKEANSREKARRTDSSSFSSTAEHERSKTTDVSKSLPSILHSITARNRSNQTSSKKKSSEHEERDEPQLPDLESSDDEIYTPTAGRVQGRRKRLYFEEKSSEPTDLVDVTPTSESSAAKDSSKKKRVKLASRASKDLRRGSTTSTSRERQSTKASKSKSTSRESSVEVSEGEESVSTNHTERIKDLRRRLFESTNDGIDDNLDANAEGFESGFDFDDLFEDRSAVRDAPTHESLSEMARPTLPPGIEDDRRSVETSTDGTMSPRGTITPIPSPAKSAHGSSHSPEDPDPSTVKAPRKRRMLFAFDTTDDDDDSEEERARTAHHEEDDGLDVSNLAPRFLNVPAKEKSRGNAVGADTPINRDNAKKHANEVKARAITELNIAEEKRRQLELQTQRIADGLRRLRTRKEYRQKLRKRKSVDKTFPIDKPAKSWATDKLYEYLTKRMEKKCGSRAKVKSERFVVRLAEFATMIAKRKKYEKYAVELEELMVIMAKLGIIETRYDFYRFCADFMPYSFREKVVPIAVPGNRRTIPYFAELTNVLLVDKKKEESGDDSSSEHS